MTVSLTERLRRTRSLLQKRRWLARLIHSLLAGAILLLVAALLAYRVPLQEQTAFLLIAAVAVGWLAFTALVSYRVWRKPVPLPHLAAQVEQHHPHWMDGLICAAELEQKPAAERRSLEQALIEEMRRETASVDFSRTLLAPQWTKRAILAALGAWLVLALLLAFTPFFAKGRFFLADLARGTPSGIIIAPGTDEAPVRSDVRVEAEVLRWEDKPVIEYIDKHGRHSFPMHRQQAGHTFTFYDIGEPIRYRVVTPSLRSRWYQLTSYIPPSIDDVEITIEPPAYTRLPEESFFELRDLAAVAGSVIRWSIGSTGARSASLQVELEDTPLDVGAEGDFSHSIVAQRHFTGRFIVEDSEGRSARTPPFQVQVKPDHPPTIEVTQPGRDTEAVPEARVDLKALAADDFGLTEVSLHVSVSGERQPPAPIFQTGATGPGDEPDLQRNVTSVLDIAALEAEEGDVVSYFFVAVDNRQPEAQASRSEIYFVEVREEIVPEEMEGEPMELEQVDLQALIVEQKRLIRQSWEAVARSDRSLEREVAAGLEEVRLEMARVQQEVIEQAGPEAGAAMAALLSRAMQRVEEATEQVMQREMEASIPPQEMALADLVAIQTELMKNQPQSQKPSESESSGQSSPQQQETAQDEQLEELQELMQQVQRMADEQGAQSSSLRRMPPGGMSGEQQAQMQQRQKALQQQAQQASQALRNLPGLEGAQRDLSTASTSMQSASERIEANHADAAARDGDRARSSLLSAVERLEDVIDQAGGNQVAQLARQAQQLAEQQAEAAGGSRRLAESESPDSEEVAALREQQQAMQDSLQELLRAIDQAAGQLREGNPDAARAVAEAGQAMREQNISGQMGRAGNALLYRRFDRAAEMQDEAAQQLAASAQALDESSALLPSMSRQQMEQLLTQLRQAQQEVMGMTGQSPTDIAGQLEQMSDRLGERIGRAAQALRDQALQEISGELRGSAAGDGQTPNLFRMDSLLRAATRSLEQQLFALEMDRRSRLQRQVSEPPEKYRGLVEEYFRSLSESP